MRVSAFREFMADVKSGGYPELRREIHLTDDTVLEALEQSSQSRPGRIHVRLNLGNQTQ